MSFLLFDQILKYRKGRHEEEMIAGSWTQEESSDLFVQPALPALHTAAAHPELKVSPALFYSHFSASESEITTESLMCSDWRR